MPWTAGDAKKHIKGLSTTKAKAWAEIANAVLKKTGDEGQAVRVANAKAKGAKKATHYKAAMKNKPSRTVPGTVKGGK